jgi:hypothetical protein
LRDSKFRVDLKMKAELFFETLVDIHKREVRIHMFLTSVPDGGELLASRPGRFTPEDRSPGNYWIRYWTPVTFSFLR